MRTVTQDSSELIIGPQVQHVCRRSSEAQAEARQFRSVSTFGQRDSSAGMLKCHWGEQ